MAKIRLGLIFGGKSVEHEVSVQSARNVFESLDPEKYDVTFANVPCVGAGVLGSAIGMDKDVAKRLLRDAGIPVAKYLVFTTTTATGASFDELSRTLGLPFFVKPANAGSSVGISKVRTADEWADALALALRYDRKLLAEEFIQGREIEVAVLGNDSPEASIPGEIVPRHEFYSYEAKYLDENGARLDIPADLPAATAERVRSLAVHAFRVLEAAGMARVDFFVTGDDRIYVNEINTIPGFTRVSMYPKLWEASGLTYAALVDRLIMLALERHVQENRLETTYSPGLPGDRTDGR